MASKDEEGASETTTTTNTAAFLRSKLESRVVDRSFCLDTTASQPLNVTCYGSSSSKTPERYLEEARLLGYLLAKRGHVCINGAGSFGCMAAMNDGIYAGDGHVRGVIHEMFLADNGYFDVDAKTQEQQQQQKRLTIKGGSHKVFENAIVLKELPPPSQSRDNNNISTEHESNSGKRPSIREIIVAGGPDLQERKKFLVANTDALIVLPGGPGTWDELWEMACARHLNLNQLPIVCVNVDGYYEPFREILERAFVDKLIHLPPNQIVRFASSAEDAVRFVEGNDIPSETTATTTTSEDRRISRVDIYSSWQTLALAFATGAITGMAIARSRFGRG